jgi:phosphoribosylformimino-5-aminoimidazole carboxamide ribotide isomerase
LTKSFDAPVQFGGGLRSLEIIEQAFDLGVSRVVLGTIAIENPNVVTQALTRFGEGQIAIGIDARDGLVHVHGWKENSGVSAVDLARQMQMLGLRTVIFTDVSRDGLGSGLNIPSTRALADASGLDVIASGGVHTLDDVIAARDANLAGVIIGRAIYDGTLDLKEALKNSVIE